MHETIKAFLSIEHKLLIAIRKLTDKKNVFQKLLMHSTNKVTSQLDVSFKLHFP